MKHQLLSIAIVASTILTAAADPTAPHTELLIVTDFTEGRLHALTLHKGDNITLESLQALNRAIKMDPKSINGSNSFQFGMWFEELEIADQLKPLPNIESNIILLPISDLKLVRTAETLKTAESSELPLQQFETDLWNKVDTLLSHFVPDTMDTTKRESLLAELIPAIDERDRALLASELSNLPANPKLAEFSPLPLPPPQSK